MSGIVIPLYIVKRVHFYTMNTSVEQSLNRLFQDWAQEPAQSLVLLPQSGSYREYYRMTSAHHTALGVFNAERKENIAFLEFSRHFRRKGLPVPEIYADDLASDVYLLQDLGDRTVLSYLLKARSRQGEFSEDLVQVYKRILDELPRFQIVAGNDLNYDVCYPRANFDQQSILWDLNYFKYYMLKLAQVPFDEQALEDDFHTFTDFLLQADHHYFLYRDCKSPNILLYRNAPYFIDYQGGRRGALQYDVASLLYEARADLPPRIREELLNYYLEVVNQYIPVDRETFIRYYYGYVLIRKMQAMGAFGFRGLYEKKALLLESIPYALKNLAWILDHVRLSVALPTLWEALHRLVNSETLRTLIDAGLTVTITSFSYQRGIPADNSGNGGGYVFDCRGIHNPGRYEQYTKLTGRDRSVIEFFEQNTDAEEFLQHVFALIEQTIATYQQRHTRHLAVNFGCTGGQHRSVYCAERLAEHLRNTGTVQVKLRHFEQDMI